MSSRALTLADCLRHELAPHRHAYRLRARRLRRLHGDGRRRGGALLPDARGAGRGRKITTVEGLSNDDGLTPLAEGVPQAPCPAMRLLHARLHHDGACAAHRGADATRTASARCCPAISAAAPATSPSSRRCSTRARPTQPTRDSERACACRTPSSASRCRARRGPAFPARPRPVRRRRRDAGPAHAVILRSSVAHGRIVSIDASAALAMPGVHAVITGADMPGGPPISDAAAAAAGVQAVRAAGDRPRQGALCRRADRHGAGVVRRPSPRTRWKLIAVEIEELPAGRRLADRGREQERAVREAGHQPLAGVPGAQGRRRRGVRQRALRPPRAASHRPPLRR